MENKENIWGVWALCQAKRLSYFLRFFWMSLENFLVFFLFLLILQPNFLKKRFLIKKKTRVAQIHLFIWKLCYVKVDTFWDQVVLLD